MTVDVAIVGCGPVGALLGNLLGLRGHSVAVLDKRTEPYSLPRAIHFDGEVMRVFQSAGLAEAVAPACIVGKGMLFRDRDGKLLVDWSRSQEPGPTGWYESYRFHQPALEAALRKGLERFAHVGMRLGVAARDMSQTEDAVDIALDDGTTLAARYVIGCDGAGSFVAQALGSAYDDLGFDERWLVTDVRLTGPGGDLGDRSIQFCDAEHPATYVRGIGDRRRWEARLRPGDPDDIDPFAAWDRLAADMGVTDVDVERVAIYRFRSRVARSWRAGRVFLAGDAAHQMPPFMGQGMCGGIRDAANLGWKLSAALAGRGGTALLDSYDSERIANVREYIERSVALGRLINQTGTGAVPKGRMASIWPPLGPGLGPRDGLAGTLCPQPRLPDGKLADTVAGQGFYVLATEPLQSALPVIDGAGAFLADHGVRGVIVRPDGYALAEVRSDGEIREAEALVAGIAPASADRRRPA